ncbi:hypothetical protein LCGC14_2278370 [marine sediment metagenome]|uniref:Uncharacterized protein n=1 Tax=marine sediment metagenome TaxID=412755 RepID=A0A0F9FPZ8_9ZZZZ
MLLREKNRKLMILEKIRSDFEKRAIEYERVSGLQLTSISISRHGDDYIIEGQETYVPPQRLAVNSDL